MTHFSIVDALVHSEIYINKIEVLQNHRIERFHFLEENIHFILKTNHIALHSYSSSSGIDGKV